MILKGAQRAGAKQLSLHVLKEDDNEFVKLHEIRGLLSDDVVGAFKEMEAIAKGTRCKQPFFSVSLSPPSDAAVAVANFATAIDPIEAAHGLRGQPLVVIFHEKEGGRHADTVWSRIDPETMTAKNLTHLKRKLNRIAHELFLEHRWDVPAGFRDGVGQSVQCDIARVAARQAAGTHCHQSEAADPPVLGSILLSYSPMIGQFLSKTGGDKTSKLGSRSRSHNVDTASRVRSCALRPCSTVTLRRTGRKYSTRCRRTSAVAEPIPASFELSSAHRRRAEG